MVSRLFSVLKEHPEFTRYPHCLIDILNCRDGSDTTSGVLSEATYLFLANPETTRQLGAELNERR